MIETARIQLINGLHVAGASIPGSHPARRLLALLAIEEAPVTRSFAAYSLWPDASEERALGCLRTAMWSMKEHRVAFLVLSGPEIGLAGAIDVDVEQLTRLAMRLGEGAPDPPDWVVSAFGRELLPGWYDEWVIDAQGRWRAVRIRALEAIARNRLAAGQIAGAIDAATAALAAEPFRESSCRLVVEAYLAEGNRGQAIGEHRRFSHLLRSELGVEPTPSFVGLAAALQTASS